MLNFRFFTRVGFYVSVIAMAALLVGAVSYTLGFTDNLLEYKSTNVIIYSLISIVAYFVLLIIDFTSNFAPVALFCGIFISFLAYVNNVYMYFTGIFYNGVSAEAFKLIDPVVLVSMICFIVAIVVSNVAFYLGHSKGGDF